MMAVRVSLSMLLPSAVAMQLKVHERVLDMDNGTSNSKSEGNWQLFTDVTETAFPPLWYNWDHVGHSRNFMGTPLFQDFNDDGYLDFFYHNHFGLEPSRDWDLGMSLGRNVAYKAGHPWYRSMADLTFVSTEEEGSEYRRQEMDTHGSAILDIDRDGLLDLYISIGGGKGTEAEKGKDKNAFLAWGIAGTTLQQGNVVSLHQRFKGGRDVSEKANIANANSRGRFTYFADFNKDGLLDVFFSNDVRADDLNAYGYAMINQGDRTFESDLFMSEYAFTMVLTDADGDGHADEFVLQRRNCLPSDKSQVTKEHKEFCEDRPSGTTAVYKYNKDAGHMKLISQKFQRSSTPDSEDYVWSMQTGDFDGDEVADLVALKDNSITFYLSSNRGQGKMPIGKGAYNISWPLGECTGRAVRTADFDLDGDQELLVMCAEYGQHRLYMQNEHDRSKWTLWSDSVGDLASVSKPKVRPEELVLTCGSDTLDKRRLYVREMCHHFVQESRVPSTHTFGIAVADWDNDGFPDVALNHDFGSLMLLHNDWGNTTEESNKFIAFKLKGTKSNEYGIGATVLLRARRMGPHGNETTVQLREVSSASHETDWWGSKDDRIVFGLGRHGIPEKVTVRWPCKHQKEQVIEGDNILGQHANSYEKMKVITEPK